MDSLRIPPLARAVRNVREAAGLLCGAARLSDTICGPAARRSRIGAAVPGRHLVVALVLVLILPSGTVVRADPGIGTSLPAERLVLESVSVDPPGREAELLVRRYLPLTIGQTIDPRILVEARDQLAATGLFKDVDLYTARGGRSGAVCVIVAATPSHRFSLETGLGFEPLGGWYLDIIGVRRTGLFDRGGTVRMSWREGLRTSGLYSEMMVPGTLPGRFDLLLDLDLFDEDWTVYDLDKSYHQKIERFRVLVGLQRKIRSDCEIALRTGYARVLPDHTLKPSDDTATLPADSLLPRPSGFLHLFQVEGSLYRDRLDPVRPWQSGSFSGMAVRASIPSRGRAFWGWEADVRAAYPVAGTRAIAGRFRAAGTSPDTPYFLRPVVGGTGSLRGFADAGLSGALGARALWQASAEWRQPLAGDDPLRPTVTGTLFVDVGDHWTARGERAGIAASLGYGALFRVRWLKTLNIEVAYPLTADPTGSPVSVRLGLGRSF